MSDAQELVRSHPGLARAMRSSKAFEGIRDRAALEIDAERLYIVRGDTLGDEADLFLETLVRGVQSSDPGDPNRAVYLDLDDEMREVIDQRVGR